MINKEKLILENAEELLNDLKNELSWEWDDRFDALLTIFSVSKQDIIQSILNKHFSSQWNNKTIKKAPRHIKAKAGSFTDLRMGQLLFTLDSENGSVLAAWWPWGDKEKVSLRIATTEVMNPSSFNILEILKSYFRK